MSDLQSLLERVRKADGADREIDALLWLTLAKEWPHEWDGDRLRLPHMGGYIVGAADPGKTQRNFSLWNFKHEILRYTASLDAALALVERVLPGFDIDLHIGPDGPSAVLTKSQRTDEEYRVGAFHYCEHECATAPLAILASLLSAKAEQ